MFPVTVVLGDPRLPDRTKPGGCYTDDDVYQVDRLKSALRELKEYSFEYLDDHEVLLDRLRDHPPRFVLNFCDTGFRNEVRHELHVPAYLELLGVPYSGASPVAIGMCCDKSLVRAIALAHGIPVPREAFLAPGDPIPDVGYPAFVKPNSTDGSLGITAESIVRDEGAAKAYVDHLHQDLPGEDVLIQEFLEGTEYSVGVIGNPEDELTPLPILEVDYGALDPSLPQILDYGSKTEPTSPYWTDVRFRAAGLEPRDRDRVVGWCRTLLKRLQLRDYARFDFRTDSTGTIKLMEVNPNPAWCWDGKLAHMAQIGGESHAELLGRIIEAARRRCFSS